MSAALWAELLPVSSTMTMTIASTSTSTSTSTSSESSALRLAQNTSISPPAIDCWVTGETSGVA
jgi:hypothetical protein